MTPKEKAEELFGKFADIEHLGVYGDYNGTWEWSSSLWRQQAKESALIAIEFAIEFAGGDMNEQFDKILYLVEVKHEIEKL
jgi:hypothetical protein